MKPFVSSLKHGYRSRRSERGVAIIVVLAALVLLSVMIISLNQTMRVERSSSQAHLERARAETLAQTGIETVVARLRQVTTNPSRVWISQPGQLVASGSGSGIGIPATPIPLHSGSVSGTPPSQPYFKPAEINIRTFEPAGTAAIPPHLITSLPDPGNSNIAVRMPVKWIYVRQDGTEETSAEPATTLKGNPIIGRYAYWTDDESTKVNFNLAWTREGTNPNLLSHPTKVDLPTILATGTTPAEINTAKAYADAVHLYQPVPGPTPFEIPTTVTGYNAVNRFFFNTPEEVRMVNESIPGVSDAIAANRFSLTHYSHDPDTTFFNEPRIVLTTRKSRAGNRPFIDIAAEGHEEDDLGDYVTAGGENHGFPIDKVKLNETVNLLNSYLSRLDWPTAPNSSFQQKYYGGDPEQLTQLSLNIIDYVRSKESSHPVVVPLRGTMTGGTMVNGTMVGGKFSLSKSNDLRSFISISRTPRITEMGLYIGNSYEGKPKEYPAKFKFEFFFPKAFGLSKFDVKDIAYHYHYGNGGIIVPGLSTVINDGSQPKISEPIVSADGTRYIVTFGHRFTFSEVLPEQGLDVTLRIAVGLASSAGGEADDRFEVIPLRGNSDQYIRLKTNARTVGEDGKLTIKEDEMPSIEVDDPRVNMYKEDWIQVPINTFGKPNSISTLGKKSTSNPQQDTDSSGDITDVSLVMPAPAGTSDGTLASNPYGMVTSVAELGFISTGVRSNMAGVPWRTLRLQPSQTGSTVVPDWAFMDLFTVPVNIPPHTTGKTNPHHIYAPHGTETSGRININAKPVPFDLDRIDPLAALFHGARKDAITTNRVSLDEARSIAGNIYERKLATTPQGHQYGYAGGFDSPGEIVEIEGVADRGEASEQLVREIGNLVTARGSVFTIYTVGQAIKQSADGRLIVTGEQRQQAMIERYTDSSGAVRFRNVYFRNLLP